MNWMGYSIIALVTFSAYDVLSRYMGIQSKNPRAYAVVFNFFCALAAVLLLSVEPIKIPTLHTSIIIIMLLGLCSWSLFGRIEYFTHKYVEASLLTILIRLATVLNFLLSVLFLNESVTLSKLVGFALTLIASVLVIGIPRISDFRKNKGLTYAMLLVLFLGLGWTFDKVLAPVYGAVFLTFMNFFVPSVTSYFFPDLTWKSVMIELKNGSWKLVLSALINVAGYAAMMKALTLGDASNVIPIATSTPPLVVLGGMVFLNEKKDFWKKIVAVVLVMIAIYFMR